MVAPTVMQPPVQDEFVPAIEVGAAQFALYPRSRPRAVAPSVVQHQRRLAMVVAVFHVLETLLVLTDPAAQFSRGQPDQVFVLDVIDLLAIGGW